LYDVVVNITQLKCTSRLSIICIICFT